MDREEKVPVLTRIVINSEMGVVSEYQLNGLYTQGNKME